MKLAILCLLLVSLLLSVRSHEAHLEDPNDENTEAREHTNDIKPRDASVSAEAEDGGLRSDLDDYGDSESTDALGGDETQSEDLEDDSSEEATDSGSFWSRDDDYSDDAFSDDDEGDGSRSESGKNLQEYEASKGEKRQNADKTIIDLEESSDDLFGIWG